MGRANKHLPIQHSGLVSGKRAPGLAAIGQLAGGIEFSVVAGANK